MREEHEDKRDRRKDDVTIKLPFGIELSGTGRRVASVMLTALIIGTFLGGLYLHDKHSSEADIKMDERFKEIIYVLTLSEKDRAALKLDMPQRLRNRFQRDEPQ